MRFAIIGAQKSASTSLQKAIARHPEIYTPHGESALFESAYYSPERVAQESQTWARESGGRVIGIKRPDYLALPEAPANIAKHYPDAKFVVVLRNPADRALSAHYHYVRYGLTQAESHEVGLRRLLDADRAGTRDASRRFEILDYGYYGRSLNRWVSQFPRDRIFVVRQEDLLSKQEATLSAIFGHIGVDSNTDWGLEPAMEGAFHPLRVKVWGAMNPVLYRRVENDRLVERSWLVNRAFSVTDTYVLAKLLRAPRPRLSPELRRELAEYYESDLRILARDFGIDVALWLPTDSIGPH